MALKGIRFRGIPLTSEQDEGEDLSGREYAPKDTAETPFETSVSTRAASIVCSASVDFVYTTT